MTKKKQDQNFDDRQNNIGDRILAARTLMSMSQTSYSERLGITCGFLSLLEKNKRKPSISLLKLMCYEFKLNMRWLFEGDGEPFLSDNEFKKLLDKTIQGQNEKCKNRSRDLLITAAVLGPVAPALSGAIAAGIGASVIVEKMKKAYQAKNITRLAEDSLGVDRSTVNYWLNTNTIPSSIIRQCIEETELTYQDFEGLDDFCIINKKKFAKIAKRLWIDKKGQELTDDNINDVFENAVAILDSL